MSNAQHTRGPWRVSGCAVIHDYADGETGTVTIVQWPGDNAEQDANTLLIAAAPDLLVALESAMQLLKGHQETAEKKERYQKALSAIAKATGC